jgi:hypothetical protein
MMLSRLSETTANRTVDNIAARCFLSFLVLARATLSTDLEALETRCVRSYRYPTVDLQ